MGAFIGYYLNPSIGYVFVITIILRLFEYGINKPTREVVFSYLKRTDRYKSTVMVDTFLGQNGRFYRQWIYSFIKIIWIGIFTSAIVSNSICWMFSHPWLQDSTQGKYKLLETSSFA